MVNGRTVFHDSASELLYPSDEDCVLPTDATLTQAAADGCDIGTR